MRLIDADEFFKNYPELDIEPYNNAPTVETGHYLTNCQNCQSDYSRGYDDGYKEGYKAERSTGKWYDHIPHKCLKARYGGYVLYDVDYLLKHLAMEIYLLEGAGRTRGEEE